ncbi:MAG: class I SAM-dependent methyltransferase [Halochromatium sp.]|uniref:class I SAM-dependent methyltransferase n=1 Tax=Halochromatium sp. TaxID=2049430 RepID=UPI00397AB687
MARSGFEERWRQRFVQRGRQFDDDAGIAGWTTSGLDTRLRHFQRVWPGDVPGARWLDAGCGAGSYTRYLASRAIDTLGLDYSLPSVQKARARSAKTIRWLVGDATKLPIRPGSMDGVMCLGVLQALSAPESVLTELLAATRPGGQVWVDALNRRSLATLIKRLRARLGGPPLNLRYDDPEQLRQRLLAQGAESVRIYWVPILPGRLQRLQPWIESRPMRWLLRRLPWLASPLSHAFLVAARKVEVCNDR